MTVVLVCVRLLFLLRRLLLFLICRDGVVWLRYTLSMMPSKAGGNATKCIKLSSGCFTMHVCVSIHMVVSILLVLCKRNPQHVLS